MPKQLKSSKRQAWTDGEVQLQVQLLCVYLWS